MSSPLQSLKDKRSELRKRITTANPNSEAGVELIDECETELASLQRQIRRLTHQRSYHATRDKTLQRRRVAHARRSLQRLRDALADLQSAEPDAMFGKHKTRTRIQEEQRLKTLVMRAETRLKPIDPSSDQPTLPSSDEMSDQ